MLHHVRGNMWRVVNFVLIFSPALFLAAGISMAQTPGTAPIAAPVLLRAEFHSGETVRYTFSQKMNLTTRVDPNVPSDRVATLTPRQYEVHGDIVAAFASTSPGEPLHGSVKFQDLTIENWVSSAKVADLEARLRQLEATATNLTAAADGHLELADLPAQLLQGPYVLDVEDLQSLAQALLISRLASEPLAPGQGRESTDFPVPGLVKPGLNMTVRTEYLADVPVARQPSAEVRLSMHVPNQVRPVSSEANVSKTFERLYAVGDWTYLLNLGTHQISFLHKKVRTETGYSVENADSNEAIRIPRNLFSVEKRYEVTARRVAANESPEREADLAGFEKSLAKPRPADSDGSGIPASPGGEVSLGDVARRMRAEQAVQPPPPAQAAEPTVKVSEASPVAVPAGFKEEVFPSGAMTAYIPNRASEIKRTSNFIGLRLSLGNPTPLVIMSMLEIDLDPGESADHALQGIIPALEQSQGIKVVHSERKSINGMPGMLIDALAQQPMPIRNLESLVVSGSKGFIASCGTLQTDFPKVQSLCRTMVESTRAR